MSTLDSLTSLNCWMKRKISLPFRQHVQTRWSTKKAKTNSYTSLLKIPKVNPILFSRTFFPPRVLNVETPATHKTYASCLLLLSSLTPTFTTIFPILVFRWFFRTNYRIYKSHRSPSVIISFQLKCIFISFLV